MYFLVENDDLLEKEFVTGPVYNKNFLKTKIKSHKVTDFYDKEIPKVDSDYTCLAVISLDSSLKKGETIILKYF